MSATRKTDGRPYEGSPAEVYERYIVPAIGLPCATPVVEAAEPHPGERILDVACGTGVVARLVAQRVGNAGQVVGIDSNPDMLKVAGACAPTEIKIKWQEASADSLPFPDGSFDAALCSLGLQFFPDQTAALTEMRRVLVPTGRVAIGVPGPTPALFEQLHDVLAHHFGTDVAAFVHAVFSIHEPARLDTLLAGAGLDDIDIRSRQLSLRLPAPADFFCQYMYATPLSLSMAGLDADERRALENDIVQRWRPFADEAGMNCRIGLTLATAKRHR